MFWNTNSGSSTTWIDTLLDSQDVNLLELLREDELIQECKSQNKKLIDFLVRAEVLQELVRVALREPLESIQEETEKTSNEDGIRSRYRYAAVACEVLTCEASQVTSALAQDPFVLAELLDFLRQPPPLNPLLASFFSRILALLVSRSPEQNWFTYQVTCLNVIEFLRQRQPDCVQLFLNHIGTSAIMDLLFKIITKVEGSQMKESLLEWLDENGLVEGLIDLFIGDCDARRSNASQLLCDVIIISRDLALLAQDVATDQAHLDRVAMKIHSAEMVVLTLETILRPPRNYDAIAAGVSVLLTLISFDPRGSISPEKGLLYDTLCAIIDRLPDLLAVLDEAPPIGEVATAGGAVRNNAVGGAARVAVAQLLAQLWLSARKHPRMRSTLPPLIRLFFACPSNNFIHTHCEAAITAALTGDSDSSSFPIDFMSNGECDFDSDKDNSTPTTSIEHYIFIECELIERIATAWKENKEEEKSDEKKRPRRGYMGHLIRLATLATQHFNANINSNNNNHNNNNMDNSDDATDDGYKLLESLPGHVRNMWTDLQPELDQIIELHSTKLAGGVKECSEHSDSFYQPNNVEDFGYVITKRMTDMEDEEEGSFVKDVDEKEVANLPPSSKEMFEQVFSMQNEEDDMWTSLYDATAPSATAGVEKSSGDARSKTISTDSNLADCRAWQEENSSDDDQQVRDDDDDLDDWPETGLSSTLRLKKEPDNFVDPWGSDGIATDKNASSIFGAFSGNQSDKNDWANFKEFSDESLNEELYGASPFLSNVELNSTIATASVVPKNCDACFSFCDDNAQDEGSGEEKSAKQEMNEEKMTVNDESLSTEKEKPEVVNDRIDKTPCGLVNSLTISPSSSSSSSSTDVGSINNDNINNNNCAYSSENDIFSNDDKEKEDPVQNRSDSACIAGTDAELCAPSSLENLENSSKTFIEVDPSTPSNVQSTLPEN